MCHLLDLLPNIKRIVSSLARRPRYFFIKIISFHLYVSECGVNLNFNFFLCFRNKVVVFPLLSFFVILVKAPNLKVLKGATAARKVGDFASIFLSDHIRHPSFCGEPPLTIKRSVPKLDYAVQRRLT